MTAPKIEYWDNGKVARDKINTIIDEVNASIPSIWENWHWYIWGVDTGITAVWVELRVENNLIQQNAEHETYTDLQFGEWLTPVSSFPIWITVGNIDSEDWRPQSWIMINARTDISYYRMIYGDDWILYFDWWTGVFKRIATTNYVDSALLSLRGELHTVAFTWKSSDLDNDAWFTAVPIMTQEQYDDTPWTAGDDKDYLIYENI